MLVTLSLLTSCTLVPVAQRQVNRGAFEYAICEDGLEVQTKYRAFQGYNGWFYYHYDLEPSYPLMNQTDFMVELGRRLQAQGVRLVIVPVPSRAIVAPQNLYPGDPQQAAFKPTEGVAQYDVFVKELRDGGVLVFDVLAEARASDARGQQTFFKRDLHWTTEGAKLFHDLSILEFDLTLAYDSGENETLRVTRSNLVPNRGLYFFSLNKKLGNTLKRVRLRSSKRNRGACICASVPETIALRRHYTTLRATISSSSNSPVSTKPNPW